MRPFVVARGGATQSGGRGRSRPVSFSACSLFLKIFLKNTVIERRQLTKMGVIRCYALLKWGRIRFKCINNK